MKEERKESEKEKLFAIASKQIVEQFRESDGAVIKCMFELNKEDPNIAEWHIKPEGNVGPVTSIMLAATLINHISQDFNINADAVADMVSRVSHQ